MLSIYLLSQEESVGEVAVTCIAKFVTGLTEGFPLAALVKLIVVAVRFARVGVPGVLARV